MSRALLIAVLAALVAACAQVPQQRKNTIAEDYQAEINSNAALCEVKVAAVPKLDTIKAKFPLRTGEQPSIEMLTNNQRPSDDEKLVIIELDKAILWCEEIDRSMHLSAQYAPHLPPTVGPFRQERSAAQRNLRVDLVTGKYTWGEYSRARHDTYLAYLKKGADLKEQVRALNFQQQQALAQQMQTQALIANQRRNDQLLQQTLESLARNVQQPAAPTSFSCRRIGSSTNCTPW